MIMFVSSKKHRVLLLFIILMLICILILSSCSLVSLIAKGVISKPISSFSNIVGARIFALTRSGSKSIANGNILVAIAEDGKSLESKALDNIGSIISMNFDYDYLLRINSRFFMVGSLGIGGGNPEQIRYGLVLIDSSNGKAYSLSPPYVQEAIAHVDAIYYSDPKAYISGDLKLGSELASYASRGVDNIPKVQTDAYGNIYLIISSDMIVSGSGNENYGNGNYVFMQDLVKIDITNMTQQSLFSIRYNNGLDQYDIRIARFVVDPSGIVFFTISNDFNDIADYSIQSDQIIPSTSNIDILHSKGFWTSDEGFIYYLMSSDLGHISLSPYHDALYKLNSDGSGDLCCTTSEARIVLRNSRGLYYWLISDSSSPTGYSWQEAYDEISGVPLLPHKISFPNYSTLEILSINESTILFSTLDMDVNNNMNLYYLDLNGNSSIINNVAGLAGKIAFNVTKGENKIIANVYDISTMLSGKMDIIYINGEFRAENFIPITGVILGSGSVPLIML